MEATSKVDSISLRPGHSSRVGAIHELPGAPQGRSTPSANLVMTERGAHFMIANFPTFSPMPGASTWKM